MLENNRQRRLATITTHHPPHLSTKHRQRRVVALEFTVDRRDIRQRVSLYTILVQLSRHAVEAVVRLVVKGLATFQALNQGDAAGAEMILNVGDTRGSSRGGGRRSGTESHLFQDHVREGGDDLDVITMEGAVFLDGDVVSALDSLSCTRCEAVMLSLMNSFVGSNSTVSSVSQQCTFFLSLANAYITFAVPAIPCTRVTLRPTDPAKPLSTLSWKSVDAF
jgi:hypothetical protein